MWNEYGKVAIEATRHIQKKGEHPRKSWNIFAQEFFGAGTDGANKGCPRSAYLGLCEDGLVAGVPSGDYVREQKGKKLNKSYALQAVRMLCNDSSLENDIPDELWSKVMEVIGGSPENHDNQMNVVLALWHEGMIVKAGNIRKIGMDYDIYSEREQAKQEPTPYQYNEIPHRLDNQILYVLEDITNLANVWNIYCRQKGMPSEINKATSAKPIVRDIMRKNDLKSTFDVIEIAFQFAAEQGVSQDRLKAKTDELNNYFRKASFGYQLTENRIVRVDSSDKDTQQKTKQILKSENYDDEKVTHHRNGDNEKTPETSKNYYDGGFWHLQKGRYDAAIEDFTESLKQEPYNLNALLNRSSAWAKKGEYDKAIADCNEIIRLKNDFSSAWSYRGAAWYNKGEYDKAIEDLNRALFLEPNDVNAWEVRGDAFLKKKKFDKAITDYKEAYRLSPADEKIIQKQTVAMTLKTSKELSEETTSIGQKEKQNRIDFLVKWFHKNYKDPAYLLPHDSKEGGYQWIYGGPCDAKEELINRSPEESEEIIEAAVREIESDGLFDWSPDPKSENYNSKEKSTYNSVSKDMHKAINTRLNTIQNATPLAESFEWNSSNQKIRHIPVSVSNTMLWKNNMERLHDEISDIKNNNRLSNTHAALISEIERLESRLEKYKNSPQQIHDEMNTILKSVQLLENEEGITNDVHTQRFKEILNICVLDIKGDVPEVQEVVEKRKKMRLTQLPEEEQNLLTSITEKVIPYIEEEQVKQDIEQDVEAFKENQNDADSQEKTFKSYRWVSRLSRMLDLLRENAPGFLKAVGLVVINKIIEIMFKVFGP